MANKFDFTMTSLNTKGLRAKKKRIALFRWLKKLNHSIVFLQETHSTLLDENQFRNEWGIGEIYYSHGKSDSRGVAILLNKKCDIEVLDVTHVSPDGRILILEVNVQDTIFKLINIYAPNTEGEQKAFYKGLHALINKYKIVQTDNIIIGGDYNVTFKADLDKKGGVMKTKDNVLNIIDDINSKIELHDIWRCKNPNKKAYTWKQKNPEIHCRLDYWFISEALHDYASLVDILPCIRSDHDAIVLQLKSVDDSDRGRGYWKMNTSILDDEDFIYKIN